MEEHLLVPVDGSEEAEAALEYALERFPGEELTVVAVVDPADAAVADSMAAPYESPVDAPGVGAEWLADAEESARERVALAGERAEETGFTAETVVRVGRPGHAIVEYATDNDIDHIVMGSHGRSGLSRVLLGSVAETVMRRADCPVTVVR
ncbi:universal stress protein [Halosegnis marinus]|uniref:Universal stress protein n=1 Tax=Halosegnis marinus TaxID=3034023 RepID=A0ABD5ZMJ6_9EURY|nr:universal stress protein [Halosegnis sp. DT85]